MFGNMFYCKFNNFQDEQGGRIIRWTLGNEELSAIVNKAPQLRKLRTATQVIDAQAFEAVVDSLNTNKAAQGE